MAASAPARATEPRSKLNLAPWFAAAITILINALLFAYTYGELQADVHALQRDVQEIKQDIRATRKGQ